MRLIFLGSGEFACPTLRWLAQSEYDVPLVITQPARGAGRGRRNTRTPVAESAREFELDVLETENVNAPDAIERIKGLDARLGLVIAFGQKLGNGLLNSMPGGCINLHASLLPKYRGAAPINWAIVRGEERTGCTVFRIVEKMDAGPILATRWTYIKPDETAGELHDRLAGVGVDAVQTALGQFADGAIPDGDPQNHAQATLAPKLKKSDGVIDWSCPAEVVVDHILGMTPWPGATTCYASDDGRWEKVAVTRARIPEAPHHGGAPQASARAVDYRPSEPQASACATGQEASDVRDPTAATERMRSPLPPGTIDPRLYVATADGFVEILEIKPSSGRIMTWPDYVNGRHVKPGDAFGTDQ